MYRMIGKYSQGKGTRYIKKTGQFGQIKINRADPMESIYIYLIVFLLVKYQSYQLDNGCITVSLFNKERQKFNNNNQ